MVGQYIVFLSIFYMTFFFTNYISFYQSKQYSAFFYKIMKNQLKSKNKQKHTKQLLKFIKCKKPSRLFISQHIIPTTTQFTYQLLQFHFAQNQPKLIMRILAYRIQLLQKESVFQSVFILGMNIKNHHIVKNNDKGLFSSEQLKIIRTSFSYRYKIQEAVNKFQFKQTHPHQQNIQNLLSVLEKVIELEPELKVRLINCFGQFLKAEENIPIQVNIKKIRYDQLAYLLEEWENSLNESSLMRNPQRLYSIQHKNILFSRVFFEQKQNIEQYFATLSQKKMLKGVDLYQLLVSILSPYYLYEFSCDNQTFFEKVNSFNNFLEVVDKFINSESRIILDNKSKDFEFIKLYQFEALIYYWQSINPQLQLRSDKRFSNASKQVQTEKHEIFIHKDTETQTIGQKDKLPDLQTIINSSLKQLNMLTEVENQPQILEIIQNLCESLRLQKITLNQFLKTKQTNQFTLNQQLQRSPQNKPTQMNRNIQRISINYSQNSDLQLQKTQRISMKLPQSPQQKKSSASKRKNQPLKKNQSLKLVHLDKNIKVENLQQQVMINRGRSQSKYLQRQKSSQKRTKHHKQDDKKSQISQLKNDDNNLFIKNLNLSGYDSDTNFDPDNIELRRIDTATEQQKTIFTLFELIYQQYSDHNTSFMTTQKLNQFFIDIGIIQQKHSLYELKCLRGYEIKNPLKIKQVQFLQIMSLIMKADEDLTFDVIAQFVDLYVHDFDIGVGNNNDSKTIDVKINGQRQNLHPQRFSENRSYQVPRSQIKIQHPSFAASTAKKQRYSPSYNNNFPYSRNNNPNNNTSQIQQKRKRYLYCQQTPRFQLQTSSSFKRFTQTKKQISRQKRVNITPQLGGYRSKYPLQKY